MDLLTYLRRFEPEELVHICGDTYATRTHDSLKISNGDVYKRQGQSHADVGLAAA